MKRRIGESANRRIGSSTNRQISKTPRHPVTPSPRHPSARSPTPPTPPLTSALLTLATFAPLALILLVSLVTPLYHVRYLFTYSPAFYVVLAAGIVWVWRRWKLAAGIAAVGWLVAAGFTLHASWFDPAFRADDHRAAVRELRSQWRPGDVLLVNAGYAYPSLATYWDGAPASRTAADRAAAGATRR